MFRYQIARLMRVIFFVATVFRADSIYANFSAPPAGETSYRFTVLAKPGVTAMTARAMVEAVNATVRTNAQAALHASLDSPVAATLLSRRIPTDYEKQQLAVASTQNYSTTARILAFVELTYTVPSGVTSLQAVTNSGTALQNHADLLSVEQVIDASFSSLPIEQGGYLGNGVQPFDTSTTQWGMHTMRFPQAWEKIRGTAYVGVIDNGIDTGHPDLQANYRPQFSRNVNTNQVADDVDEYGPPAGHGTHVAGIIAATHNNLTQSVVGGCASCSLQIIRGISVIGSATAANFGAQVMNMSFETPGASQNSTRSPESTCTNQSARCTVLANARDRGVAMVAAAGNMRNQDVNGTTHQRLWAAPANIPSVIAVSGLQYAGVNNKSFWGGVFDPDTGFGSNWGVIANGEPQIALIAPAKDVLSTFYRGADWNSPISCGDSFGPPIASSLGYGLCTGTSMAAPHVTAAAALVKSANPLLTGDEVKTVLTSTAAAISGEGMNRQGYGVPRVDAAVQTTLDQGGGGRTNAVNRVTPLFGFFTAPTSIPFVGGAQYRAYDHFYTTVPQMGLAARIGTLQPLPKPVLTPQPSSWQQSCAGPTCGLPPGSVAPATLAGPITIFAPNGVTIDAQPVPSLPTPFKIKLTATASGYSPLSGYVVPPYDSTTLETTVRIHGSAQWTITASVEYLDFPVAFASLGKPIPGYSNLTQSPINPDVQAGEGSLSAFDAKAIAGVMTTHKSPFASVPDAAVVPLYRLSWRCGDTSPAVVPVCNPSHPSYLINHVAHAYATPGSLSNIQAAGYKIDGVEGYLFSRTLTTPPPGTVKLCQRYNPTTDDYVLFLEADAAQGCESTTAPHHGGSTLGGVLSGYSINAEAADQGFLGYAFADLTPRALFKSLLPVPLSLANTVSSGSFEEPNLFAGTVLNAPENVTGWEFIGEAGLQSNGGFGANAPSPDGTQTAWIRNAGKIRTVVKLTPGTYALSFSAARARLEALPLFVCSLRATRWLHLVRLLDLVATVTR